MEARRRRIEGKQRGMEEEKGGNGREVRDRGAGPSPCTGDKVQAFPEGQRELSGTPDLREEDLGHGNTAGCEATGT